MHYSVNLSASILNHPVCKLCSLLAFSLPNVLPVNRSIRTRSTTRRRYGGSPVGVMHILSPNHILWLLEIDEEKPRVLRSLTNFTSWPLVVPSNNTFAML